MVLVSVLPSRSLYMGKNKSPSALFVPCCGIGEPQNTGTRGGDDRITSAVVE